MSRDDLMVAVMEIREECKSHPDCCVGCSWFKEPEGVCGFQGVNCPEEWTFRWYITEEGEQ